MSPLKSEWIFISNLFLETQKEYLSKEFEKVEFKQKTNCSIKRKERK